MGLCCGSAFGAFLRTADSRTGEGGERRGAGPGTGALLTGTTRTEDAAARGGSVLLAVTSAATGLRTALLARRVGLGSRCATRTVTAVAATATSRSPTIAMATLRRRAGVGLVWPQEDAVWALSESWISAKTAVEAGWSDTWITRPIRSTVGRDREGAKTRSALAKSAMFW
jgi:hypothetical protein